MIVKKTPMYVGLLRADNTEPSSTSGYTRISIGEIAIPDCLNALFQSQVVFEEVRFPGYGEITAIAVFLDSEGSGPVVLHELPAPVDVHEGVIPAVIRGQLIRGVEVKAEVNLQSADLCGV